MNEVRVSRKGADRVTSGHPWIFSSDIADRDGAQPGRPVKVADPRGRPLGTAHYSSSSQISLRMLSRQVEEIGRDFFLQRLRAADGPPPLAAGAKRNRGRSLRPAAITAVMQSVNWNCNAPSPEGGISSRLL